jgi:hypothetical protein
MADYAGEEVNVQEGAAYVSTWNTKELLKIEQKFCPLCIDIEYGTAFDKPLQHLANAVKDFEKESHSPVQFIRSITLLYNMKIRQRIVDIKNFTPDGSGEYTEFNEPYMTADEIYQHYKIHKANTWLCNEESIRQVEAMKQRTADTCMTMDGPVNPNSINSYERLIRIGQLLKDNQKKN